MGDRHGRYRMREKLMRKKLMRRRLRRALFPMVMGSFMTMAAVGFAFYQSGRGGNSGKGTVTKEAKGVGAAIGPIIRHGFMPDTGYEYMGDLEAAAYSGGEHALTYSGDRPLEGHTAAGAFSVFNLGDKVLVDGALYVIEDRVGEDAREKLRIYFNREQEAREYGRNTVSVYRNRHVPEKGAGYLGEFEVTGYCGCKTCCGKKDKSLTRTGTEPRAGHTIAVDSRVIPLGTRIVIDGVTYLAEDTGKAIKGNQADIYFDTHEEAVRYGRRKKNVYLYHESNP